MSGASDERGSSDEAVVNVQANSMSGEEFAMISCRTSSTVGDIKARIAEKLSVPCCEQRLLLDKQVMHPNSAPWNTFLIAAVSKSVLCVTNT